MNLDRLHQRRETLAHCLRMAASDKEYARWAANEYERNAVYGGLFEGLRARFDTDLSRARAREPADAAR